MSGASPAGEAPAQASAGARERARARRGRSWAELGRRFLTLREGSIIVVTILAGLYFAIRIDRFFSHDNFVALLPYFAPFAILAAGEVLLMVAGRAVRL